MADLGRRRSDGIDFVESVYEGADQELSAAGTPVFRLIRLERFETPYAFSGEARDAYVRRCTTLFVDDSCLKRGGNGAVVRARNAWGESFALKMAHVPWIAKADASGLSHEHLRREYELQRCLSGLRGFPRLFGWGWLGAEPVIVMEWIECVTLARAAKELAVDDEGRLSPLTAARIGRDLFDLVSRMDLLEGEFVHRDISPANVLVRTAHLSLQDQVDEGVFDLCLIDFGSAVKTGDYGTVANERYGAVPAYAAPEMLKGASERLAKARCSAPVDVYAAASVIYELACGRPPYASWTEGEELASDGEVLTYGVKSENAADAFCMAHRGAVDVASVLVHEPEVAVVTGRTVADYGLDLDAGEVREALALVDLQLEELIEACLAGNPADRPPSHAVRDALATFCFQYADNVSRALRDEGLVSCLSGSPASGFGGSPARMRNILRSVGKSGSLAVFLVVVLATGLLVHGSFAAFSVGSLQWEGALSGPAVTLALASPALAGFAVRGRRLHTVSGFVQGSIALGVCALLVLLVGCLTVFETAGIAQGLGAAWFAAVAAAWAPLVADYALAALPARRRHKLKEAAQQHLLEAEGESGGSVGMLDALQEEGMVGR